LVNSLGAIIDCGRRELLFRGAGGNGKVSYPTTSKETTKGIRSLLLTSLRVIEFDDMYTNFIPHGNTIKGTNPIVRANRGLGNNTVQFEIDAAVHPGNSGGLIYDKIGNVVGVVIVQLNKMKFAKMSELIFENVNFGIKASTVRQFLSSSGLPTKWTNRFLIRVPATSGCMFRA